MTIIRIGTGAGFADDRIQHGIDLVNYGMLDYIVFECLAERTIAIALQDRLRNPKLGYNQWLEDRIEPIIKDAKDKNIKIITNMGAANVLSAMDKIADIAQIKNLKGIKIAAITGDDVLDKIIELDPTLLEDGSKVSELGTENLVAANAYLGAEPIVEALSKGADIVITGRVADPSLFVAPIVYESNWPLDKWDLLGKATCAGHLMECGTYVSGAFYCDPGVKDVEGLEDIGQPICEFNSNGEFLITKRPNSGGEVSIHTCSEQILYEVHNPSCYITPDVVADFSKVYFEQHDKDKVRVFGATGRERTDTLKVSVAYRDSTVISGEISYCGINCVDRAKLAGCIISKRLNKMKLPISEEKIDIIGYNSLFSENMYPNAVTPNEVRLRYVVRTETKDTKLKTLIANEIRALSLNGPYGYGGANLNIKEVIAVKSALIPRSIIKHLIYIKEV